MKEIIKPVFNEAVLPTLEDGTKAEFVPDESLWANGVLNVPPHLTQRHPHLNTPIKCKITHIPKKITLFLSDREIQSIKNFYESLEVDISTLFDFSGSKYCGRTYVEVTVAHETIIAEDGGIRIKGLGDFYCEFEDE